MASAAIARPRRTPVRMSSLRQLETVVMTVPADSDG
jgi:hypothetical protein